MDSEKELLDAFEMTIHEDFPNPARLDCPGHEALLQLAEAPASIELTHLLVHIRQCALCFDELKKVRRKARSQSSQHI